MVCMGIQWQGLGNSIPGSIRKYGILGLEIAQVIPLSKKLLLYFPFSIFLVRTPFWL